MKFLESEVGRRGRRWRRGSTRVLVILGAVAAGVILVALLRRPAVPTTGAVADSGSGTVAAGGSAGSGSLEARPRPRLASQSGGARGPQAAAAVVADKLIQFTQNRRQRVETLAQRFNVTVPPEVENFFSAVESGNWGEIKGLYNTLSALGASAEAPAGMASIWPAIRETYAVAQAKEVWPAEQLLSYGESVLSSLKPGTVYVGGSEYGQAIPSLLNETSGDGRAVLLDHGMLSDPGYVDYLTAVYGDQLATPSQEDAERAKKRYIQEAGLRAQNNQLLEGETAPTGDARELTPGSAGATAVSDKLLLVLLAKNPGMSVAVEKPTPGSPLYELATPMGPIFEVRSPAPGEEGVKTTAAQAEQSVQYWRDTVDRMQTVPDTEESQVTRRSFAEMAVAQAKLLASRSLGAEAEQTYRSAVDIAPSSIAPVGELATFLHGAGRTSDAQQALDDYLRRNPGKEAEVDYFRSRLVEPKP